MISTLLRTKVQIPPQQEQALDRPRLLEQLERGVVQHPLTLVAAPAGYGKTTLLSGWAHQNERPLAWLSIDHEENDPDRFLRYLLAAWEQVQPQLQERPPGLLLSAPGPDRQAVLTAFVNEAGDLPGHLVFVLDDYHLIENPVIHEALAFLLDHNPPHLHFVLSCRGKPPLPLARYRARRQLWRELSEATN